MKSLARLAVRHRWWVVAIWAGAIVAMQALSGLAGGATYRDIFTLPGTQTQQVLNLLRGAGQGGQTGQVGTIVLHARDGALDPSAPPDGLLPALRGLCGQGLHVAAVTTPWGAFECTAAGAPEPLPTRDQSGRNPLLSTDDTVGLVTVQWQGNQNAVGNFTGVYDRVRQLRSDRLQIEFTGAAFVNLTTQPTGIPPEAFGFVAALLILAVVFRTVGATVLPLLSAGAALGVGLAAVALLSHVLNVATFATELASLMVIGVGIDYALFIVTRHRRNLMGGLPVAESIVVAIDTSGRAVLFAGATVCVAILGLCALGVSFLYGVAIGTAIAVGLTMIASLTLLPAVLSLLGERVLPRRARAAVAAGRFRAPDHPTRWADWSRFVARHKAGLALVATAVIVVLAVPFFSMRLGEADQGSDPKGTTTRSGYELIADAPGFGPGYTSVLELVVSGPTASDEAYLRKVATALAGTPDVDAASVSGVPLSRTLVLLPFKSRSASQDAATTDLVHRLRDEVAPNLERGSPNHVYVFGQTAIFIDFAQVLGRAMPYFFAAVIGLSFLLLLLAFRSLVVPLTAAAMNLFAAGASFGIIVAVFQWGWGSEALGIGAGGPISAFLPVLFFAVLFGLSMDYQVFLVSRMHEEWVHTRDNHRSISVGQAETGGIITAAAIIMIAVFGGFLLGDARVIKMIGLGLGCAIFIDAFILRTVLVPALMHALGRSNWWFPRWLDRITPRVSVEPAEASDGGGTDRGTDGAGADRATDQSGSTATG